MAVDIFVSYARQDQDFAIKLKQDLRSRNIEVWIDQDEMIAGGYWRGQITKAIKECRVFLLILSPNSVNSNNVNNELSLAVQHDRQVVPILYRETSIPDRMEYPLAGLQYQSFCQGSYEANLKRLLNALQTYGIAIGQGQGVAEPAVQPLPQVNGKKARGVTSPALAKSLALPVVLSILGLAALAIILLVLARPSSPPSQAVTLVNANPYTVAALQPVPPGQAMSIKFNWPKTARVLNFFFELSNSGPTDISAFVWPNCDRPILVGSTHIDSSSEARPVWVQAAREIFVYGDFCISFQPGAGPDIFLAVNPSSQYLVKVVLSDD